MMRVLVAVGLLVAASACTATVDGEGRLAAEAYVPPTARSAPSSTATPALPRSASTPTRTPAAPTPTASRGPRSDPQAVPAAFSGTWRGQVSQPRSTIRRWTAVLALPAGRPAGTFQVRGYCSGSAVVVTASATRLVLLEVITSDPSGQCADSGTVVLTRAGGGRLRMTWTDSAARTNTGTGTLTRG